MPTPDEMDELKVIVENLTGRTPTDEEIGALMARLKGNQAITVQFAKQINNVNEAQNSQFGDRLSQGFDTQASQPTIFKQNQHSVDELVQQVRLRFHDDIQCLHGKMPLLGIDHWVDLGELFVDVNILEEVSSSRKSELDDLWQDFSDGVEKYSSYRSLDRIGLGKHQERVSGLTVLVNNTNLMVVGKPGSGKTTYLQHIVTECNAGQLQPQRIPVLIKLREFVDDGRSFEYNLERYLTQQWRLSELETELVLSQGRALILLDGLDEVTGTNGREISKQIKRFARTYPQNQLIVTCRTQSQESRFERFDDVEVADFNEAQVKAFAEHWFKAVCSNPKEGKAKARQFLNKLYLEENKPIRELAITPILLSLTCAVFQAQGKFYSKRSKLYEEGLELLLQKWDKLREIERDEIYRDLSPERKQELLSYLAVKKFEQPQYVLFEQEEIEGYIAEFLEISQRDSRVVLRAIEAQHGLLIERSQNVWSFSHLTFQEYFVAKWFYNNHNDWLCQAIHIIKRRWQVIFSLVLERIENPDELLIAMKSRIDNFISSSTKIQKLITKIHQVSLQFKGLYKLSGIRAFCLALVCDIYCYNTCDTYLGRQRVFAYKLGCKLNYSQAIEIVWRFDSRYGPKFELNPIWSSNYPQGFQDEFWRYEEFDGTLNWTYITPFIISEYELEEYDISDDTWWIPTSESHQSDKDELRELLLLYYDSNNFLLDCLSKSCAISDKVRKNIEETLFLPSAEIEKHKRKK